MSTPTPTPSGNRTQTQEKPIRVSDDPLEFRQFYFNYAKYHYNPTNKLIHLIFIPQIIFTIWALLHYAPSYTFVVSNYEVTIDISLVVITIVSMIFSLVDTLIAFGCLTGGLTLYFISLYLYVNDEEIFGGNHLKVMLAIHIVSWIFQFIGHGIFEKRAPALSENVFLLFLAPFFVILEVLHFFFGYRDKEIKETNIIIAKEIEQFRRLKKAKASQ
ncbi:UNKNOWN [Stylonychia lemnae]|uniref:Uncharacterized protein n=1 Tax=Stylonychia lemnae TaxID=5949 RepID=A0A078ATM0_STYLE|nr:UNKNOWN [Stylonychia lemnae]|eukprot:CDW85336.1 UNKNOWN [Stylonychia lemnae]